MARALTNQPPSVSGGRSKLRKARFSAVVMLPRRRSAAAFPAGRESGACESRRGWRGRLRPCTMICAAARACWPARTWTSSRWPLPDTPAMPTISWGRTSSDRPDRACDARFVGGGQDRAITQTRHTVACGNGRRRGACSGGVAVPIIIWAMSLGSARGPSPRR